MHRVREDSQGNASVCVDTHARGHDDDRCGQHSSGLLATLCTEHQRSMHMHGMVPL